MKAIQHIFSLVFLPLLLLIAPANYSSARENTSVLHFRICSSSIDESWKENLQKIDDLRKELSQNKVESIKILSAASPDGSYQLNSRLSQERSLSTVAYLKRLCPSLPDSAIVMQVIPEDIDGLITYIYNSGQPWAETAVSLLKKPGKDQEEALRDLDGGKVWKYLADNVFPLLRRSEISITYYKDSNDVASVVPNGSTSPSDQATIAPAVPPGREKGSVPAWAIVVMSGLGAAAAVFGLLFARERKRNRSLPEQQPVDAKPVDSKPIAEAATIAAASVAAAAVEEESPSVEESPVVAPVSEQPQKSQLLDEVKAIIQENISDSNFGVEELAAKVGISRIHLNRRLKSEANASPSALLKEARMELAANLLREGKLSVAEIGAKSGFSSASYFATAFKDYFKISPTDFIAAN